MFLIIFIWSFLFFNKENPFALSGCEGEGILREGYAKQRDQNLNVSGRVGMAPFWVHT